MSLKKSFQELDFSNAFLFAAAMEKPEICRGVLERILEIPILRVAVVTEKTMAVKPEGRSVRLDVFADDGKNTMYNVEMQTANQGDLPMRSRYHQAQMDIQTLKAGSLFSSQKESYVIFICTFDPFGDGKFRYRYEEKCEETGRFLEDGTHKIFLNSRGKNPEEVPEALVRFLKYAADSTAEKAQAENDPFLHELHETLTNIKQSGDREVEYMTLEEYVSDRIFEVKDELKAEGLEEGRKEGRAESEKTLLTLLSMMAKDGLAVEIPRLSEDNEFLIEMKQKYNLI